MKLKTISLILASTVLLIAMYALSASPAPVQKTQSIKPNITVKVMPEPKSCDGYKIRTVPLVPRPHPHSDRLVWGTTVGPMTITTDDSAVATVTCTTTADSAGNYTCTSTQFTNPSKTELDLAYAISVKVAKGGHNGEAREDPVIIVQPGP